MPVYELEIRDARYTGLLPLYDARDGELRRDDGSGHEDKSLKVLLV